ncbi:hypothetical protein SteCoe_6103 [Stentor coeruleus]|uniref:Uncharacterized protein n=1 Tax=Stentor coeruleus TaxID=5963 RepID=A0A1R2CR04_9CILI|nr:hypothetical protein SteCoe_6103 [Stentor coeruleus]
MSKVADLEYSYIEDSGSQEVTMEKVIENLNSWSSTKNLILSGHSGSVWAITSTSDNSFIFSGAEDNKIIIWDGKTHQIYGMLEEHQKSVNVLALTNDENSLVSGCWGNKLKVWDWRNKTKTHELAGHNGGIYASVMLKNSNYFITGGQDCFARIWDLNNYSLYGNCETKGGSVFSMAVTKNEKTIITGTNDGNLRLWEFGTWKNTKTINTNAGPVQSMVLTPNDNYLIIGTRNNIIKVYNWSNNEEYWVINSHSNWIRSLVTTNDSKHFISASADKTVRIFEISGKKEESFRFDKKEGVVYSLHLSKDGRILYTGASDNYVRKWIIWNTNNVSTLLGHTLSILCQSISEDNKYLVTSSSDKTIMIWDLIMKKQVGKIDAHTESIWSVSLSHNMKYIASGSADKLLKIWDFEERKLIHEFKDHTLSIFTIDISPDDNLIATGSQDMKVRLFSFSEKKIIKEFTGHTNSVFTVKFSHVSDELYSGSCDNTIRIWSTSKLMIVQVIETNSDMIESIALSNDENYLVCGDRNNNVNLWNWKDKKLLTTFSEATKWIKCVTFSNDNSLIASACNDGIIRIYNLLEKRLEMILNEHKSPSRNCVFTKDGRYLISVSEDQTIKIWDLENRTFHGMVFDNLMFMKLIHSQTDPQKYSCQQYLPPLRATIAHVYSYTGQHKLLKKSLHNGTILTVDKNGHSPLYYALERNIQNCVDVILEYMIKLAEDDIDLFVKYCWSFRDDYKILLKNVSVYLPDFLENLLIVDKTSSLPKFGIPLRKLPSVNYNESDQINHQLFVQTEIHDQSREINLEFLMLPFKIDCELGSEGSLELLRNIYTSRNKLIYRTEIIQMLIRSRWNIFLPYIITLTVITWADIVLMLVLLVNDYKSVPVIALFGIVNIALFLYEVVQAVVTGIKSYISFWNFIDFVRTIISLLWIIIIASTSKPYYNEIGYIMVIFNFLRGLSGFRAFDSTRFYVRLIIRAIIEVIPFILIFFYTTLFFGSLYWTSGGEFRSDSFYGLWQVPFELNMGNFNNETSPNLSFLSFMFGSVINVIIILNLLISILGDSYDKFQSEAIEIGAQEMTELIIEIETMMFWKRNSSQKKYINICNKTKFEGLSDEWEGKLKAISSMIIKNNTQSRISSDLLNKKLENIEEKLLIVEPLKKKLDNIDKVVTAVDALSKKIEALEKKLEFVGSLDKKLADFDAKVDTLSKKVV